MRPAALLVLLLASLGRSAGASVEVQVLVFSTGAEPDRVSVTYAGPVSREQASQDLHGLTAALNTEPADVRITSRSIAKGGPKMTSVEASYPALVSRAEGRLLVQPFIDTYDRFSHLHLTFFVGGAFKLVSPSRPFESGDVRLTVDNQGAVVNYDVWIRHTPGAAARIPSVEGSPWLRLLVPGLFVAVLIAAVVGVVVYVLLRRSGAHRASLG